VLWSILEALKGLHENNTMHRDVSPDNIFLQDIGPPVLLDLGAARHAISDSKSQHYTAVLKVNYAPIEQYAEAEDLRQGPWTDLYSLAAVVHDCLCNEPPLPATSRLVRDRMPAFASVAQTVKEHFGLAYSAGFVAAISHALTIQPGGRPQSVQEFADAMSLGIPDGMLKFEWRTGYPDLTVPSNGTLAEPPVPVQPRQSEKGELDIEWPSTLAHDTAEDMPAAGNLPKPRKKGIMVVAAVVLLSGLAFLGLRTGSGVVAPVVGTLPPVAKKPAPANQKLARTDAPRPSVAAERHAPVELCADSNFIARPMCIHLECQKPQFKELAVCIEDHKRYPPGGNQ